MKQKLSIIALLVLILAPMLVQPAQAYTVVDTQQYLYLANNRRWEYLNYDWDIGPGGDGQLKWSWPGENRDSAMTVRGPRSMCSGEALWRWEFWKNGPHCYIFPDGKDIVANWYTTQQNISFWDSTLGMWNYFMQGRGLHQWDRNYLWFSYFQSPNGMAVLPDMTPQCGAYSHLYSYSQRYKPYPYISNPLVNRYIKDYGDEGLRTFWANEPPTSNGLGTVYGPTAPYCNMGYTYPYECVTQYGFMNFTNYTLGNGTKISGRALVVKFFENTHWEKWYFMQGVGLFAMSFAKHEAGLYNNNYLWGRALILKSLPTIVPVR